MSVRFLRFSFTLQVTQHWGIKVADFGLSCLKEASTGAMPVSVPWCAPEVLSGQAYTAKSDVYSFGIIMWEMLSRKPPYPTHYFLCIFCSSVVVSFLILKKYENLNAPAILTAVTSGMRPIIPDGNSWPPLLLKLAQDCWKENPDLRPNFSDIKPSVEAYEVETPQQMPGSIGSQTFGSSVIAPAGRVTLVFTDVCNISLHNKSKKKKNNSFSPLHNS